jgi:hypothetical protein
MMGKFELFSVAEDYYKSNRLTAKQEILIRDYGLNAFQTSSLQISVDTDKTLTIHDYKKGKLQNSIVFPDLDIDGMIEYLQDVKTFISEEEMIKKLAGKV